MSAKVIKRPLLFANLSVVAVLMIAFNVIYSTFSFPKIGMKSGIIKGEVVSIEEKSNYSEIILKNVDYSGIEDETIKNFINKNVILKKLKTKCVLTGDNTSVKIGQTVTVSGKFGFYDGKTNPGQFDLRKYYFSKETVLKGSSCEIIETEGRGLFLSETLRTVRKALLGALDESLNERDAGLMKAILLADKSEVDADTKEMYQDAGASHILAISGLHISLLASGILFVLQGLSVPKKAAYAVSTLALIVYGLMIGFSPSVSRATVMFAILCFGKIQKRSYDPLTSMSAAAVVTVAFHPLYCLQSGFLLSYLAIVGMTVFTPAFENAFEGKLFENVKFGVGVTLFTLPAVIGSFYKFPLYSVFLNLILVPGMTVVICAGFLCMVFACVFPYFFNIFALLVHWIFKLYDLAIGLSLKLPFSNVLTGEAGLTKGIIYLTVLSLICIALKETENELYRRRKILLNQKRRYPARDIRKASDKVKKTKRMFEIAAIAAIAIDVLFLAYNHKRDKVTFLDVGQGLCAVMEIGGKTYCFDGGSSDKREIWKYVIKPFLLSEGKDSVEIWFVSHSDNDHVNGLKDAMTDGDIEIKRICMNDCPDEKKDEIKRIAYENNIDVYTAHQGQKIEAKKALFYILAPKSEGYKGASENENSLVVMVETNAGKILFTGDAGYDAEKDFICFGVKPSVFQVAHHGSAVGSNSAETLKKLKPQASIISCGFDNPYGHPHTETLESLSKYSKAVFRTDEDGAITIVLKNDEMRIYPFIGE